MIRHREMLFNDLKIYLDRSSIIRHVGATYFSRGQSYFACGRVTEISLEGCAILGKVSGTKQRPYRTNIMLGQKGIISSDCNCPIGSSCKHVAALAIATLKKYGDSKEILEILIDGESGLPIENLETCPQWVESFKFIDEELDERNFNQLQFLLQFKNVHAYSNLKEQWELQIRPRIFNPSTNESSIEKINWGDATRDRYFYNYNKKEPIPENMSSEHFLFFKQLTNALRINYTSRKWEKVDRENASNFWQVIKRAEEVKVALLCGYQGKNKVEIYQDILDAALVFNDKKDGSLEISQEFTMSNHQFDKPVALIGDPPIFGLNILEETESSIINHFSIFPVSDQATKIIQNFNKPVIVPESDRDIFQEKYMPVLTQKFQFKNNSSKLAVPKKIKPKAFLQIDSDQKNKISLNIKAVYDDVEVSLNSMDKILKNSGGQIILRDLGAESKLKDFFQDIDGFEEINIKNNIELEGMDAVKMMIETMPLLYSNSDIKIEISKKVPKFYEDKSDPKISFELNDDVESSGWFDLGVKVKMGGESIIFSEIFVALARGDEFYLTERGRYFSLRKPAFDRLQKLIRESQDLKEAEKGSLKLSRFQIGFWDELEQLGIVEKQAQSWKKLLTEFKNSQGTKLLVPPKELQAKLRPYQIEGYSWLNFLYQFKLGGILADDMGLGKTIQTIALIIAANREKKNCNPFLVIAPTSVVENWEMEIERFAPKLKQIVMRRGDRTKHFNSIIAANIVITSYSLFQRDFQELVKYDFEALILD